MDERQFQLIKHLFDLAGHYYTYEDGFNMIPEHQPERDFIQEVYMACAEILDYVE